MREGKTIFDQRKKGRKGGAAMQSTGQSQEQSSLLAQRLIKEQESQKKLFQGIDEKTRKTAMQKGLEDFVKDEVKRQHEAQEKLRALVKKTQRVVYQARGVWPFDFFPDEIVVDTEKVNIINRPFFYTAERRSVMLKDISDVIVDSALFFATIRIIERSMTLQESSVSYLWKRDAIKAQQIIQGLVAATMDGIDLSKCNLSELVEKAQIAGHPKL